MKILLTGQPKIGKTEVIRGFRTIYRDKTAGIITHALWDSEGHRDGFEAETMSGEKKLFAHKSLITSSYIVKNKFHVDVAAIDTFIIPEIKKEAHNANAVIIVDEIGRMQSFSAAFLQTVAELLSSEASVLATIVHDPEPWSLSFKSHPEIVLLS